ncbi:glycosyltransferase [Sphingomonas sp.]|uniref:CgeB family protein n=1 Tax=Sphingomonas sp. TaxID=28214 RepID=UPI001821FDBC|nr:glycosyltransferase [Sphingomonas sp.]MBA4760839.1 glycosyltransferase [Sphingomonas sp.]
MRSAADPARPIRAVMATEFWHGCTGRALAQGLRDQGWMVAEHDTLGYNPRASSFLHRAANRLLTPFAQATYNRDLITLCKQVEAEVMVTVKGSYITGATLTALRDAGVRCVNFYPDFHFDHHGIEVGDFPLYDYFATTKSFQLDALRKMLPADHVALVHHGYAPLVHVAPTVPVAEPMWDVSHIGNPTPYKRDFMVAVAEAFPDLRIAVIGNRWTDHARGTALERHVVPYPLTGDFFAHAIAQSRINVAMHFGPRGPNGWYDRVSTRTFEIPAVGGFMLHIDNEEVRGLYTADVECALFSDAKSLCDQIERYLADDHARATIAAAGHARCVPAYSLDARAAELAALLRARGIVRDTP